MGLEKTFERSLAAGVLSFYDVKTKLLSASNSSEYTRGDCGNYENDKGKII